VERRVQDGGVGVAAHEHDAETWLTAGQPQSELGPAHAGHRDVREQEIDRPGEGRGDRQGIPTVARLDHVVAELAETARREAANGVHDVGLAILRSPFPCFGALMRPRPSLARRLPLLAILTAAALGSTLAGCDLMVAVPTPHPSRLVATPEPTDSATATEDDEVPTIRPDPSGSGPDLLDAADALADLKSYRVSVTTRGIVPATPASAAVTMTSTLLQGTNPAAEFSMAGVDGYTGGRLRAIVIGEQAWLKEGGGRWVKSPGGAADFDAAFTTLSPIDLVDGFDDLSGALHRLGTEQRNGKATIHYHADANDELAVAAGLTSGSVDAWLATSGRYLVGLAIDGTWDVDGTPTPVVLRIDVTHVNDRANKVSPPA